MFSERLAEVSPSLEEIGRQVIIDRRQTEALLEKASSGQRLELDELVALLNGLSDSRNAQAVLDVARATSRPNDHEVLLLPPLYFSSVCENTCAYCDFSCGQGVRLTCDQFIAEVQALIDLGYRSIELVSGQDPELFIHREPFDMVNQRFDVQPAAAYFRLLKDAISSNGRGMVTSNVPPVCTDGFRQLRSAGLDCFLAWLETFNPDRYTTLHSASGPKGHQAFRLDSFDRAREAGIGHVAGAFLKGLYDWRKEEAALYLLDQHLEARWGRGFSIIGTPRVKGRFTRTRIGSSYWMDDAAYELNLALDRILFNGTIWLQTREPFQLNRRLLNTYGGGVVMTVNCSTAPGGYSEPTSADPQFPVHYTDEMQGMATLQDDGFTVRSSWGPADLDACCRPAPQR